MKMKSKLIAITMAFAISLAAVYAVMIVSTFQRVATITESAVAVQAVSPTQRVDEVATEQTTPVEQPAAPAPEQVQSLSAPVVEDAPLPEAPEAPVSPWAEPMNTVGIAESDQPIVLALAFTGYDWNLRTCACAAPTRGLYSSESRLHYLNLYVNRTYGSWTAAQARAATGNW